MTQEKARDEIYKFSEFSASLTTEFVRKRAIDLLKIKIIKYGFDYQIYLKTGLLIEQPNTNTEAHTEPKPPETERKSLFDECKQCKNPFKKNVHHQKFCSSKCKDTFHNLRKTQT